MMTGEIGTSEQSWLNLLCKKKKKKVLDDAICSWSLSHFRGADFNPPPEKSEIGLKLNYWA